MNSVASARNASARALPSGAGSRARRWSAPSMSTTSPPRRCTTWPSSTPAAPGGDRLPADDELGGVRAQRIGEGVAERRRLPGEEVVGALDEHHLAAEALHDLAQLDPG